jgi:CheY-like chemotaxis protein
VFEAADGRSALRTVEENPIRVVVCDLYLDTGESRDLITAIRSNKSLRRTRTVAHTRFAMSRDRDWARRVGADAYLIRPVRSERLRDVVARVAVLNNRKSLDVALDAIEKGTDRETSTIVVGRDWWHKREAAEQAGYRKRAKTVGARLLANRRLSGRVVEVRARRRGSDGPYS